MTPKYLDHLPKNLAAVIPPTRSTCVEYLIRTKYREMSIYSMCLGMRLGTDDEKNTQCAGSYVILHDGRCRRKGERMRA